VQKPRLAEVYTILSHFVALPGSPFCPLAKRGESASGKRVSSDLLRRADLLVEDGMETGEQRIRVPSQSENRGMRREQRRQSALSVRRAQASPRQRARGRQLSHHPVSHGLTPKCRIVEKSTGRRLGR